MTDGETGNKKKITILLFAVGIATLAMLLFGGLYFGSNGNQFARSGAVLFGGGSFDLLRGDAADEDKVAKENNAQEQEVERIPGDTQDEHDEEESSSIATTGPTSGDAEQIPETGVGMNLLLILPAGAAAVGILECYRSRTVLIRAAMSRRHFSRRAYSSF